MSISHSIFIRSAFFITLLILTTTQAHAHSTLDYLNSNAKIRKDIENKKLKFLLNKDFSFAAKKSAASKQLCDDFIQFCTG